MGAGGGVEILRAFVRLGLEGQEKIQHDLEHTKGQLSSWGSTVLAIGGGIAAGVAAYHAVEEAIHAVYEGIKSLVEAASEAEQIDRRLSTAIKAAGSGAGWTIEQLKAMQGELQETTRFSRESAASAEALLLTFSNVKGDIFKGALKSASDLASFLGGDLPQSARMLGRALQDPAHGMLMLRRAGVVFTEAEKKAVKDALLLNDTLKAQELILAAVNKRFGGQAAGEVKTLAGSYAQLKNEFHEILIELGSHLNTEMGVLVQFGEAGVEAFRMISIGIVKLKSDFHSLMALMLDGVSMFKYVNPVAALAAEFRKQALQEAIDAATMALPKPGPGKPGPTDTNTGPDEEELAAREAAKDAKRKSDRGMRQKLRDAGVSSHGLDELAAASGAGGVFGYAQTHKRLLAEAADRKKAKAEEEKDAAERKAAAVADRKHMADIRKKFAQEGFGAAAGRALEQAMLNGGLPEFGKLAASLKKAKEEKDAPDKKREQFGIAELGSRLAASITEGKAADPEKSARVATRARVKEALEKWENEGIKINGAVGFGA